VRLARACSSAACDTAASFCATAFCAHCSALFTDAVLNSSTSAGSAAEYGALRSSAAGCATNRACAAGPRTAADHLATIGIVRTPGKAIGPAWGCSPLARRYSAERLEATCTRDMAIRAPNLHNVNSERDAAALATLPKGPAAPLHGADECTASDQRLVEGRASPRVDLRIETRRLCRHGLACVGTNARIARRRKPFASKLRWHPGRLAALWQDACDRLFMMVRGASDRWRAPQPFAAALLDAVKSCTLATNVSTTCGHSADVATAGHVAREY
jgi:hypothetical protein